MMWQEGVQPQVSLPTRWGGGGGAGGGGVAWGEMNRWLKVQPLHQPCTTSVGPDTDE